MAFLMGNTCETGLADEADVTAANSDDGSAGHAFATSKGAGSTIKYDSGIKAHGGLSHHFVTASGESNFLQWTLAENTHSEVSFRVYFYLVSLPTATSILAADRNASAGTGDWVVMPTTGELRRRDAATTAIAGTEWSGGSGPILSTGTWYRLEWTVTAGTTTSNGRVRAALYALDSTSAIKTLDTGTTVNTGTTPYAFVRWGRTASAATAADFYLDDYAAISGGTYVGPVGSNLAPTVSVAASQQVARNTLATVSWSASDSDGTIASHSITQTGGTAVTLSGSGSSRTFTPTVAGTYTFTITATDDDGAVSAAQIHTVYVYDVTARPTSVVSNAGAFTNVGGASSLQAALADESDTTYIASPDSPSGAVIEVAHTPLATGNVTVKTRNRASAAAPAISRTVALYQGTTLIASATINPLPTVWTDHSFTTSPGETAAITDRNALRVRITDTQA